MIADLISQPKLILSMKAFILALLTCLAWLPVQAQDAGIIVVSGGSLVQSGRIQLVDLGPGNGSAGNLPSETGSTGITLIATPLPGTNPALLSPSNLTFTLSDSTGLQDLNGTLGSPATLVLGSSYPSIGITASLFDYTIDPTSEGGYELTLAPVTTNAVPEPRSFGLFMAALLSLAFCVVTRGKFWSSFARPICGSK
jgi:hypothetical protein